MRFDGLITDRLRLEPAASHHAAGLFAAFDNWDVVRWLARPGWPQSRDQLDAFLAGAMAGNADAREATAAIMLDGRPAGVIGLDQRRGAWNIGYWLGEPWWGRGLMTEAAHRMISWFFETRDELFLTSGALEGNAASLRIQHKLGFVQVGESMIDSRPFDRRVGHVDTLLGRARWRNLQAQAAAA